MTKVLDRCFFPLHRKLDLSLVQTAHPHIIHAPSIERMETGLIPTQPSILGVGEELLGDFKLILAHVKDAREEISPARSSMC